MRRYDLVAVGLAAALVVAWGLWLGPIATFGMWWKAPVAVLAYAGLSRWLAE